MLNDDLLEKLVGQWDLRGNMGKKPLHHLVAAEWVLNHQFLQISTMESARGENTYEALYFIGWSDRRNRFIMHLIDSFGGGFSETLGFGDRKGNSLVFAFTYPDGDFDNTFSYDPETDFWEMILRSKDQDHAWHLFARKKLQRTKNGIPRRTPGGTGQPDR